MSKRTLLMLGGSESQVVAIKRAKEIGYRTVLCDYLPDNPGKQFADIFYLVSTTDKDAVLDVAKNECIDGVVAYGSDPAAPTAAYVAEALHLPGIPYDTARDFCEKQRFRDFLAKNGFETPRNCSVLRGSNGAELRRMVDAGELSLPLIVKPSDSSGSKGVTVLRDLSSFGEAIRAAEEYTRNGVIEVEEFIEASHEGVIEAEIFVYKGKVVSWGLMRCLRDSLTNPLLPAGYRHPLNMKEQHVKIVKESVSELVKAGGICYGALNIEMVIDAKDRLFFLDAGPRNGGNMLPAFFSRITGDDIVEGTLRCAMGEPWNHTYYGGDCAEGWYMHVLHSRTDGKLQSVEYSRIAREALQYENVFLPLGSTVRPFRNSLDIVGLAMFRFPDSAALDSVLSNLDEHIKVVVE